MLSMFTFFVACGSTPTEVPNTLEAQDMVLPTNNDPDERRQATIRQLSVYDGHLECEKLPSTDRQSTLTYIVENVSRPPWAPMRAATCLAKLYPEESQDDLVRWVANPKTKGLAFLLTKQIPNLPEPVAKKVAIAGLQGPFAEDVRTRLINLDDTRLTEILHTNIQSQPESIGR